MPDTQDLRLLGISPYRVPRSKLLNGRKPMRVTRRQIEVIEPDSSDNLGGIVQINRKTSKVTMPNGEDWNYGGCVQSMSYFRIGKFLIWKLKSESTDNLSTQFPFVEEMKARSLDRIKYPWRELGCDIKFIPLHRRRGHRKVLGSAFWPSNQVEIYLKPWDSLHQVTHTLAHEIGHIVDWKYLTDRDRIRWRQLRGFSSDFPWDGNPLRPDWKDPCGDFAECFAAWQLPDSTAFASKPMCENTLQLLNELTSNR